MCLSLFEFEFILCFLFANPLSACMEEVKELFLRVSEGSSFEKEIATLHNLLLTKQIRVKKESSGISLNEAENIIDLLQQKDTCLFQWNQLFPQTFQLDQSNTDK